MKLVLSNSENPYYHSQTCLNSVRIMQDKPVYQKKQQSAKISLKYSPQTEKNMKQPYRYRSLTTSLYHRWVPQHLKCHKCTNILILLLYRKQVPVFDTKTIYSMLTVVFVSQSWEQ